MSINKVRVGIANKSLKFDHRITIRLVKAKTGNGLRLRHQRVNSNVVEEQDASGPITPTATNFPGCPDGGDLIGSHTLNALVSTAPTWIEWNPTCWDSWQRLLRNQGTFIGPR
jgi:hypothetical protein